MKVGNRGDRDNEGMEVDYRDGRGRRLELRGRFQGRSLEGCCVMMFVLGGNGVIGGGWRWILKDRMEWDRKIGELGRWRNEEEKRTGNNGIGLWEGIKIEWSRKGGGDRGRAWNG